MPHSACDLQLLLLGLPFHRTARPNGFDGKRLYFWVQFFPGLAVLLLFLLYQPKYTGTHYWIVAGVLYALAKLFEFTDGAIYSVGNFLSGHTLKHLTAAAACFAILRYFQTRRLITWPSARRVGLPVPKA